MFFSQFGKNLAAKFPKRNALLCVALVACFGSSVAMADSPDNTTTGNVLTTETKLKEKMFVTTEAEDTLNDLEMEAIKIAEEFTAKNKKTLKPIAGQNGSVRFVYGAHQPSIVCAVLQVCDIELQAGEQVNSIHLGDSARWMVEPAITGSGEDEIQHLIIKPMDSGLHTSLIVTTDRRTYHLSLKSHKTKYMTSISFSYPEDVAAQFDNLRRAKEKERAKMKMKQMPKTNANIDDLSFNYKIEGDASWKPTRVYNDGKKTIIEMPESMQNREAPALLLLGKENGWFSDEETHLVNYRLQGSRYIVDSVFDKAVLMIGVGSSQERVTITRVDSKK